MACKYLGKRYGVHDVGAWMELMQAADSDKNGRLGFSEFQEAIVLAQEKAGSSSQ